MSSASLLSVLMIGSGEYTTGFVQGKASASDKSAGVVGLVMFDLRHKHRIDRLLLCGTDGNKFPMIRKHMKASIEDVYGLSTVVETYPDDNVINPEAYVIALNTCKPGDVAIIFTPDDTHYKIAMACIAKGLHVLVTKPMVKTLAEHTALCDAASAAGVILAIEMHKRWDPIYVDARDRIKCMGGFSFFTSYMSQPKHQLQTFKAWAGKSSDISYYLNSHHIDYHEWCVGEVFIL
jgi:D-galacturonate reductase